MLWGIMGVNSVTVLGSIYKRYSEWRSENCHWTVSQNYQPKLYIGCESWRILKKEMGDLLSYYSYPQEHDTVMGMKIVVVGKKFHLEVK